MEQKIKDQDCFPVYPKDELADKRQKILTLEEKGVWSVIRWMCCDSEHMGYLTTGRYKHKNLKKIFTGYPEEKTEEWLKTFLMVGLLAKNENGELYSPEIVEYDCYRKSIYEVRARAGAKGGKSEAKRKQNASKSEANLKQTSSKMEANVKQNSSKSQANCKQNVSKTEANIKQNVSTCEQSPETLQDTDPEKSASETVIPENADDTTNNKIINNNNLNINKKIFIKCARTCAREGDIEPPPGMPRNEDEAVAMGELVGIPATFIKEKAYPRILSIGYMEGKTQIRNFGQWAKLYYGNWINSQNKNKKEHEPEKKYKNYMFDDKPLPRL